MARVEALEAKVRALEAELERTHRLATLGTIAGSIAHEFNNILTPVLSYAQLALASPDDRALLSKAVAKAAEGSQKAAEIASAMLGFVRDGDSSAPANVLNVVKDAVSCIGGNLGKDGIELVIDVPADCTAAIKPIALHQVMLNLLLNAVSAIRPSPGRISIEAWEAPRSTWNRGQATSGAGNSNAGTHWLIRVSDSGRGVPTEVADRVFDPLVSAPTGPGSRRGTGLGLSICKQLIERAGGTISLASTSGSGAVFEIRLPKVTQETHASAA